MQSLDVHKLKVYYMPEDYYRRHLKGSFGKHTQKGWFTWKGLCPFHDDKKAGSFCVNVHSGGFYCHSCKAKGGDIVAFHQQKYSVSFKKAIEQLWGECT